MFAFSLHDARAQAFFINASTNISSGTTSFGNRVTVLGFGVPNVTLTVQNPGTVLNLGAAVGNSLYTGYNVGGSGSAVIVTNGGRINASDAVSIGYGTDGVSNNRVIVTGANSAFVGNAPIFLSRYGFNNSIVVSNGGLLSATRMSVGGNPLSAVSGPYSPKVTVTGLGSVLRTTDGFEVGRLSAAQLTLGDGGTIDVGRMTVAGNDPGGSGMLIGNGTVNVGGGLAFTNAGRLAPSGTAPLTINGSLSFDGGFFDWNLFANSTNNPGTDFTRPIVLNGDISGVTSSRLVVNLTNSVASGAFWDTSRAWDLITTTSGNLSLGTRLGLSFTGNTNDITLANFSLLSTNNALRLVYNAPPPPPPAFYWNTNAVGPWTTAGNWSANAVPGATNAAFINHGGTSTLNTAAAVGSVVIGSTNGSAGGNLTLANGGVLTASNVTVASAAGSTGVLTFSGGALASPTITFGSGTGSVVFNQPGTLSVTVTSAISGPGSLVKAGLGTTTLTGNNTYSGGTLLLTNGRINFASNSLGTGTITIGAASILDSLSTSATLANNIVFSNFSGEFYLGVGNNSSLVLNGTISGGGPGVVWRYSGGDGLENTGVLTLNGTNSFEGTLEVFRGPLTLGNARAAGNALILLDSTQNPNGSLQFSSSFTISNNIRTINSGEPIGVAAGRSNGLAGVISGSGGINKVGAGTLYLLANNTYTRGTLISAGALSVGNGGTAGTLGTGRVTNNASLFLNRSNSFTVPNAISGTGILTQLGTGTVTLSGTNTYSGDTRNYAGAIALGNNRALGTGTLQMGDGSIAGISGAIMSSDATARTISNAVSLNNSATFGSAGTGDLLFTGNMNGGSLSKTFTINNTSTEFRGVISGNGARIKAGPGTMIWSGENTQSGLVTISSGILQIGNGTGTGRIGTGNVVNNATLVFNGNNPAPVDNNISGTGALIRRGAGTTTLAGLNTYAGTTTVEAGALYLNGEHTGGAAYEVNSGGTLGGLGSTTSLVNVAAGGNITPGAGATEELIIGGLDLQGRLNVFLDGDSSSLLSVLGGATLTPSSSVSFSQGANALTAPIYVFLAATNGISGTFGLTNNVPTGYGVFYDANDGIAFLKDTSVSTAVTAIFEGENAVIGNGSTNFGVFVYNGSSTTAVTNFTATAGALTTGGPLSTNNVATNSGVELSGLSFTNPGTTFGTNTGNFQTVVNGATNTVDYEVVVYDHARGSLGTNRVSLGAAIVGFSNALTGSLQVNASNTANGFNAPLGADVTNSPTNTLEFTAARDIQGGTSGNLSMSLATNQTAGAFSNNVTVTFFDDSTLSGATTLAASTSTATFVVTADIYDHASNQISGNTLSLRPVHQGAGGQIFSTNSITVTNADGFRVALGSANTITNEGLSVGTVQDLAEGTSMDIDASLDLDAASGLVGRFTNNVEVRFFDDSTLDGASTNVGTTTIEVVGYVYTGKGVWLGNGTDWAAITNWQEPGGTPGLDGALSVNDTATFDTTGTSYTVDLAESASLRAITFSNTANAYTIGGDGLISLTAASDGPATLANLDGVHTISNNLRMGSALQVTNATGSQLTLAGVLSGFNGFTKSGPGTLTLASANTYSGTTTVTGGTLQATTSGAFSSQSGVILNGGTIDIGNTTQVLPSLNIVTGTHNQTNGTLSVVTASSSDSLRLASQSGGTVVYNLDGGSLTTTNSNFQVGWLGNATFNQTNGPSTVNIGGYFVLGRFAGSSGTYNLLNGTATQSSAARNIIIGEDGIGSMTVGGSGVLTATGIIQLGLGNGSGTLQINEGGQVNAPGINLGWRDTNRLIFDVTTLTNFEVPISGAGSLVKAGAGTVVLDQDNSYRGTTTISNGALVVNGLHSGTGAYTVENGGILAGTGQVSAAVTVQSGGTINPGVGGSEEFTIGGLTLNGTLNILLEPDSNSLLTVLGAANIAGSTVNFTTNGTPTNASYIFLTASGGLTGQFGTDNTPTGYSLLYDTDDNIAFLKRDDVTNFVDVIFPGGNNAVIGNASLDFDVYVFNGDSNNVLGFEATGTNSGGTGTFGSIPSTNIAATNGADFSGLSYAYAGTNYGAQTGTFNTSLNGTPGIVEFEVDVYDHALAEYGSGNTNLTFAPVHARNTNAVASTSGISVTNASGFRVDLGVRVEDNTNSAVIIDDIGGLAAGDSNTITGLLQASLVDNPGRFTNTVQLVSYDDSDLNGANSALATNTIIVTGYVYSGQGEWNTPGGGNWANIGQWQVPGGTPGLDGEFSVEDTALFGANGSGRVTNNGSVQMLSITFSNEAAPYTIAGTGTITLASSGTNPAAINTLEGSHTVANNLELGSDVVLSNAVDTELTLSKPVDGAFGLIKEGEGTTTLAAVNTYTGGTTVNGGLLNIDSELGLANVSGNALVINEGIVSFNQNDVFGRHNEAINAPVVINEGGTLQNGGAFHNPLGPVYLNGGSIVATDVEPSGGYSFSFKGDVIVDGNATSTIDGPGLALGSDDVDFTRFEVAENSTLDITGDLIDGPAANYINSQPSRLIKEGGGEMVVSGANTYSGGTTINAGTIVAASPTALGTGPVELLAGTLELRSPLQIASLVWDGGGGATQIAIANPGTNFLTVATPISILNGVNNFNLAGSAPTGRVKLLDAPGLAENDISLFGFEGLDADAYRLEYGEDGALYLVLIAPPPPPPVPVPEPEKPRYPDFTQFAGNPNQMQVAKALNQWVASGPSGDRAAVLDALVASADYQKAFDAMMPSQYASLPNMAFNQANALNSGMFQRLWVIRVNGKGFSSSGMNMAPMQAEMGGVDDMDAFAIRPSRDTKWGTFVDGNGIFADGGDVANLQNYRSQSGGVSAGASYKWTDSLATGVYVGYQGLQAQYDNGQTIDNAVRFGVFGTYEIGGLYFNALAGGAYHDYTVDREIEFGSIDRTATGRPGAGEFDLAIGTGYDFKAGDFTFGPFTTMQYTYLGVQGFTETGADSLNLDVDPYNSSSLLYTLGAQFGYNWKVSSSVLVTPTLFAGWQHEFLQDGYQINSSFNTGGPASPFSYNTGTPARDNFYGGVGVTVGLGERWQATAIYSSFVGGNNQNSQNVYLGLGLNF